LQRWRISLLKGVMEKSREFRLGPLGTLNQVVKALGKTIRAMADGSLDSQTGARICNGLGNHASVLRDTEA
jgi:hypothetical protein